ncbi:MAG: hypothetical protein CL843_07925 [Crocinitomicaceae bacterium]|nr:hypothetical protein [Crocinitomicaceae bacterium]
MAFFQFNKPFFLLIAICWVQFAVAQNEPTLPVSYVELEPEGLVYNIDLQYKDYHLSGLAVFKQEEKGFHVVIVSKVGMSLMEFVLGEQATEWIKVIPGKDSKMILNHVEKDFRLLLLTPLHQPKKAKWKNRSVLKVKKKLKLKLKVSDGNVVYAETRQWINLIKGFAKYTYTENQPVPEKVFLSKRFIDMEIELKRMN